MIHVLLTRTPLYSQDCSCFLVRLACVRRAASVDSEPGSNSRLNVVRLEPRSVKLRVLTKKIFASNQIFKDLRKFNRLSSHYKLRTNSLNRRPRDVYDRMST